MIKQRIWTTRLEVLDDTAFDRRDSQKYCAKILLKKKKQVFSIPEKALQMQR